jgi:predicted transcriptional regulator
MKTSRYTIDLDTAFDNTLSALASQKGTTKAEIIKRALATYSVLSAQAPINSKKKVSITDSEDRVLKDVVLP